jgi:hypothetical protein
MNEFLAISCAEHGAKAKTMSFDSMVIKYIAIYSARREFFSKFAHETNVAKT